MLSAGVSSRFAQPGFSEFAGLLATEDDWTRHRIFSDKEEVPGSSPGSPTERPRPLQRAGTVEDFESGIASLDRWLARYALIAEAAHPIPVLVLARVAVDGRDQGALLRMA